MADNSSDEKAVVGDLGAGLDTGAPQVQVHLVVGTGNGLQVKVPHAVQLQLEGQSRLQVPVDAVLLELRHTNRDDGLQVVLKHDEVTETGNFLTPSLALNVKYLGNSLC